VKALIATPQGVDHHRGGFRNHRLEEDSTMWKRPDDPTNPGVTASPEPPRPGAPPPPPIAGPRGGAPARLGSSLTFEGTLTGDEDLLVEGRVVGEIRVPQHQVTVGSGGRIEGEVRASAIVIEGDVRGNLSASEHVMVRASGAVQGDIRAPRVALDQGCRFKGSIDMEPSGRSVEALERRGPRDETRKDEPRRDREVKAPVVAPAPATA
jgi:cytoskeletal protein CcmA (bactofilin family)